MQQIERYGVIALVFLLVTIVAVSFWGDSKSPGFWARLTGKGKQAEVAQVEPQPAPATTSEQALQTTLALNPTPAPGTDPALTNTPAPVPAPVNGAPLNSFAAGNVPGNNVAPTTPPLAGGVTPAAGNPGAPLDPLTPAAQQPVAPITTPVPTPAIDVASAHEYVVQKGDSLARIAKRTLGAESRWSEIQALNGGVTPNALRVGMKLKLPADANASNHATPSLATAQKSATKSSAPKANTGKPVAATTKKVEASDDGAPTYTIRKGDTLNAIAERKLGAKSRVRDILALNPGLDPHRISVGTKIKLPAAEKAPVVAAVSSSTRPHVR